MRALWVLVAIGCTTPAPAPLETPAPRSDRPLVVGPLPEAPVGRLPRTFEPTRYAARLRVDPAKPLEGSIEITGKLAEASAVIWLHGESLFVGDVWAVRAGKRVRMVAKQPKPGLLALQAEQPIGPGELTITVVYAANWSDEVALGGFRQHLMNNYGVYVFTQFEPDYARRVFPCIDEPDRKVPWQLTLDVPDDLVAASNTPIMRETTRAKTRTVEFAPTLPLPSYLVAFAVGKFDVVDAGRSKRGTPVRIFALDGDGKHVDEIAKATPELIDELEAYLGMPFPYPKLDIVAVPRTGSGWVAMENAGLVTMAASMVRLNPALGELAEQVRWQRRIVAHELAHHWFGNLVTTAWWDDLWLNESFASWLDGKLVPIPAYDHRPTNDQLRPAEPILLRGEKPREERGDWLRGAGILRMLEQHIGADRFQTAIRAYLTGHSHGNARTEDFRRVLEPTLLPVLDAYFRSRTAPALTFALECRAGRSTLVVHDAEKPVPLCIAYDRDGARGERCFITATQHHAVDLDTKQCATWVTPRMPMLGYTLAPDLAFAAQLATHAWPHLTEDERDHVAHDLGATLERIRNRVESTLRPRLDRWIKKTFAARAREGGFASTGRAALAAVVAHAGDPQLVADAAKHGARTELPLAQRFDALRVHLDRDPAVFDRTLDELLAMTDPNKQFPLAQLLAGHPRLREHAAKLERLIPAIRAELARAKPAEREDADLTREMKRFLDRKR